MNFLQIFYSTRIKKFLFLMGIILFIVLAMLWDAYYFLHKPVTLSQQLTGDKNYVSYIVKPGYSLRTIIYELKQRNVLSRPNYLLWYVFLSRQKRTVKAGEYHFKVGSTPLQILDQIICGRVAQYVLMLKEGWTFDQVMAVINQNPYLKHELYGLSHGAIMARLGYPGEYPEGMFYPDTYYFPRDMTDIAFLQRAYHLMQKKLELLWQHRIPGLSYKSAYEALIVASILERETKQLRERPIIADLILRRMRLGMRLQMDPTVVYAMGGNYLAKLKRSDLKVNSLYNTYLYAGLPPTPIALPSLSSIHAALQPEPNNFFYFVAKGDGTHQFSATLSQHNQAVTNYRKLQNNDTKKLLSNH